MNNIKTNTTSEIIWIMDGDRFRGMAYNGNWYYIYGTEFDSYLLHMFDVSDIFDVNNVFNLMESVFSLDEQI